MTSDAITGPLAGAARWLVVLAAAVGAELVTVRSDGWARLDIVLLATVLRESTSRRLRLLTVSTVLVTAWVTAGFGVVTTAEVSLAVAVATAVAWSLQAHGARSDADSLPGRRFVVVVARLALVVVVGAGLEVGLATVGGTTSGRPFAQAVASAALPLAVAALLAGALAARSVLDRRAEPHVSKLAGAFVALALSGIAVQITLQYWSSQDTTSLETAAATTTATFQQTVAADLDAFNARAGSVARTPVSSQTAFDKSVRAFLYGNSSISAVASLGGGDGTYDAIHVTDRQGSAPELRDVMGAADADSAALDAAAATGTVFLLGVRDVPGADARPVPSLVYVAKQAVADGEAPRFLSFAIALPVAFDTAAVSLGGLRQQLVLDLVQTGAGNLASGRLVSRLGAAPDSEASSPTTTASAQTVFGDIPFDVVVAPAEGFGVQPAMRSLVLGGLLVLGVLAALLMLQAANSRHRVRRYLEERETLLAAALDAAPGTVLLVDARGSVLMSNGDPESKLARVARPILEVLPFDTTGPDSAAVRDLLERGGRGDAGSVEHVDSLSDPSLHIHRVSVSPVRTAHTTSATMVVQVEDLTDQRARSMRAAQSERLRSLGTMAGGLAHDFNNLLFIISGYLQLLHDDDDVARHDHLLRYVDRAVDASERGAEIAASLLSVARSQPLEATAIEVGSFLTRLFPLVRQAVGSERDALLTVGEGPLDVVVDSGQLSGSILNLVINARDAMERGGTATVRVERRTLAAGDVELDPGDYVVISVQDDGAGMTPDVALRAFDPYFSTKGVGRGTGIGLAAVYSFARQSGGCATIETERDRGTVVSIFLPAVFAVPEPEPAEHATAHGPLTRVLVVDDETALAGLIAGWLTEQGAEVRVAETPSQALRVAQEFRPQVLLTDVRLGDPDGIEGPDLARQVEAVVPDVSVVFMTGFSDRMHDLLAQGRHTLAKPFTKETLGRVLFPVDATSAADGGGDR